MRSGVVFLAIIALFSVPFAEEQLQAKITEAKDMQNNSYVFIDVNDNASQTKVVQSMSTLSDVQCYMQRSPSGGRGGPIVIPKMSKSIVNHESMGMDLGIGAGLCVGGCIIGYAIGTPKSETAPPQGFYATVGDKVVTGGPACIVGTMWVAGLVFLLKGVIEIFVPAATGPIGMKNSVVPAPLSTQQLITKSNMREIGSYEKSFSASDFAGLDGWVKRYCLSM
jgi:hypothetical protein